MFVDYIAEKFSLTFKSSKKDYYFAEGRVNNSSFLVIKPSTYVNNSGVAASQLREQYEFNISDFLVVVDDVNLSLGQLRPKISGGDGGHNGITSIIYHLASDQFPRLRIGIDSSFEKGEMASYVLSNFSKSELEILKDSFSNASILIEDFITGGVKLMLDANSKINLNKKNKGD